LFAARNETSTPRRVAPRIALALAALLIPLALTEGILSLLGVPRGEAVFVSRDEAGEPVRADGSMVSDADVLWRFQPGTTFYGRRVNELGFLDREVAAEKTPGTRRVICLGDSCSAQGIPPYSGHLNALLRDKPPDDHAWEAFNAAVHGYTVLQGLGLYRARISLLKPDVVTIYFGWNDHWLAKENDAERIARAGSAWLTTLRNSFARKRLSTLLSLKADEPEAKLELRVPEETYVKALSDLIAAVRASGAEPLVLTAPRADTLHRQIVHGTHAESVHEAIRLHDAYADLTRRVAREEAAGLLDLAALFAAPDRQKFFSKDGIHFKQAGLEQVAELIHAELVAQTSKDWKN
ncbi:MAG TPA: SGNH/GDSL hydrolase family protein, partial [Kiritimatiellia bacterium]